MGNTRHGVCQGFWNRGTWLCPQCHIPDCWSIKKFYRNLVLCVFVGAVFLPDCPHWGHPDCFLPTAQAYTWTVVSPGHPCHGHHIPTHWGSCQQCCYSCCVPSVRFHHDAILCIIVGRGTDGCGRLHILHQNSGHVVTSSALICRGFLFYSIKTCHRGKPWLSICKRQRFSWTSAVVGAHEDLCRLLVAIGSNTVEPCMSGHPFWICPGPFGKCSLAYFPWCLSLQFASNRDW